MYFTLQATTHHDVTTFEVDGMAQMWKTKYL